ncbi:MAG: hypothetical protein Q8Q59_10040 [Luteolibacter sp.]|jgi:hypothetical protein|nr:hypothetical protein [Luteolibacter sp.]
MPSEILSKQWLQDNLYNDLDWYPERMGGKQKIFSSRIDLPLIALCIDPPLIKPNWLLLDNKTATDSFFRILEPIITSKSPSVLFLTNPDGAWMVLHSHSPLEPRYWSPRLLTNFETIPCEQGGPQYLVILLSQGQGAIVFSRAENFEINYYGSLSLWNEISTALFGPITAFPH